MSGAQAKAAVIAGCIGVIAEVNKTALIKRHKQGYGCGHLVVMIFIDLLLQ